jgi:hypothetical protein
MWMSGMRKVDSEMKSGYVRGEDALEVCKKLEKKYLDNQKQ